MSCNSIATCFNESTATALAEYIQEVSTDFFQTSLGKYVVVTYPVLVGIGVIDHIRLVVFNSRDTYIPERIDYGLRWSDFKYAIVTTAFFSLWGIPSYFNWFDNTSHTIASIRNELLKLSAEANATNFCIPESYYRYLKEVLPDYSGRLKDVTSTMGYLFITLIFVGVVGGITSSIRMRDIAFNEPQRVGKLNYRITFLMLGTVLVYGMYRFITNVMIADPTHSFSVILRDCRLKEPAFP